MAYRHYLLKLRWQFMPIHIAILCFYIIPSLALAQSENPEKDEIANYCKAMKVSGDCIRNECIKDGKNLCIEQFRFTPYQPNSAVFQHTESDGNSIEVNYSVRYLISSPDCAHDSMNACLSGYENRWEHFVSYTGKFDFYLNTRPSSPVINRLNNPAWHSRKYFSFDSNSHLKWLKWADIGVEHKSNGQAILASELIPGTAQNKAASEYANGNHSYIDSISRSVNYFSLEGKAGFDMRYCNHCNFYLKLFAFHRDEESDVYWGKYASQGMEFADFERLRAIFLIPINNATRADETSEFAIEWTIGDRYLSTDSTNLRLKLPLNFGWGSLPITVRAHFGPMNELSNYTESQRSIGIGLTFFH